LLYESENDYLALQAADNLAFEARKYVETSNKKLKARESMKRMVATGNIIRIYKFDYDALKIVADAQIGIEPEEIRKRITPVENPLSIMHDAIEEWSEKGERRRIRTIQRDYRKAFDRATSRK
jgi:hypothetical protein